MFCDGTIDQRLEGLTDEKADACELVPDGSLMGERAEEVNFAQLLQLAQSEFNPDDQTVDEATLLAEWPALRNALASAQRAWDASLPIERLPSVDAWTQAAPVAIKQVDPEPVAIAPSWMTAPIVQTPAIPADRPTAVDPDNILLPLASISDAWRQRFAKRTARLARLNG